MIAHTLLPPPKSVVEREGVFSWDPETLIVLPSNADDSLFLAACQLQEEAGRACGARPAVVKAFEPPRTENVVLLVCGEGQAAAWGLRPARVSLPGGLAYAALLAPQAYTLAIEPRRVALYADAPAGLFYAVQTLRQATRRHGPAVPALEIVDWPSLPYRGLMLDVSRRKVPTLETLQELADQLCFYKINVLQLYTEHTFRFPRHPKIGAGCGSLSSQDMITLDRFCRMRQIELMPNLQSFGHARNILLIPEYRRLAETDLCWTLSPAYEGTYELLSDLYADMLPAFSSPVFNVGCDETYDLGQGASREMAAAVGVGRVYLNHILRLRELAARHGRRIQVWGDILLHHPDLIAEVPADVTLLDWHYEAEDEYPTVRLFGASGHTFWVCPGVSSWNALFPRLYNANVNIRHLARDGVAAGAQGLLNTDWGDFGHYQPLGLSWYGYLFGAAQAWSGGATGEAEFEAAFGPLFFGPGWERILEAIHLLARVNILPGVAQPNGSRAALALFDEPLTGETVAALPAETVAEMGQLAEAALARLEPLAPGHPQELTLREMISSARLIAYAARKTEWGQAIRRSLGDPAMDAERLYGSIRALQALDMEVEGLRAEFEALWLARARRSEIHVALGYYAGLRARYRAAMDWLERQRQAVREGRPVDVGLTTYDAAGYRTLWQTWPDQ